MRQIFKVVKSGTTYWIAAGNGRMEQYYNEREARDNSSSGEFVTNYNPSDELKDVYMDKFDLCYDVVNCHGMRYTNRLENWDSNAAYQAGQQQREEEKRAKKEEKKQKKEAKKESDDDDREEKDMTERLEDAALWIVKLPFRLLWWIVKKLLKGIASAIPFIPDDIFDSKD